jgi:hypothetical protein
VNEGSRRGRWIVAGGILGLALSPGARRVGIGVRARITRVLNGAGDPEAPFRQAPCYEHDRTTAAGGPARTEAAR